MPTDETNTESANGGSLHRLVLHPVCGNPWEDESGNLHVECPKCFCQRMKKVQWPVYRCPDCGLEWELKQ